jgi:hypothetical protein
MSTTLTQQARFKQAKFWEEGPTGALNGAALMTIVEQRRRRQGMSDYDGAMKVSVDGPADRTRT